MDDILIDLLVHVIDIRLDEYGGIFIVCDRRLTEHEPEHVRLVRKIPVSRPVADMVHLHFRQGSEGRSQRTYDRGAGGRGKLEHGLGLIGGDAFEQFGRGRGGNGQETVSGLDRAGADVDGRGPDSRDSQKIETDDRAHDVHDGVDGADFVKVDLLRSRRMDFGFGLRETVEDTDAFLLYSGCERRVIDDCSNVREMARLPAFLLDDHVDFCRGDACAFDLFRFELVTRKVKLREFG